MADISKLKLPNNTEYNLRDPISYNKIISRGEQLVVNGSALLGNNTNFSSFIYDGSMANGSSGSFTLNDGTSYRNLVSDDFFPVNPGSNYLVSLDIISKRGLSTAYLYMAMYDADKLQISTHQRMWMPNTLTSLTQDLKNGDTVVHLSDLTNWDTNTSTRTYQRGFIVWNYTNSFGYTYPENTYSRNVFFDLYEDSGVNKTAKTITLKTPWTRGTISAGTKLSQSSSGSTYMYLAIRGSVVPSSWNTYAQYISGTDNTGGQINGKFWAGTAYAKIGFLWNSNSANDQIWVTNISVKEVVDYTFANGTNGFTVTPKGGVPQSVTVVNTATTSAYGITKLNSATNSTSTTEAATPSAVKTAYDLANSANTTANTALSGVNGTLIYDHTYTISNGVATFVPHVYLKGAEVTANYAASCFTWKYRLSNNVSTTPSYVNLTTDTTTKGCSVNISTLGFGGHVIGTFTPPS